MLSSHCAIVLPFILPLLAQIVSLFINFTCIYKLEMFPGQQMIRDQIPEEPGLLNFYTELKILAIVRKRR